MSKKKNPRPALTPAQRKAKERNAKREAGLVYKLVWLLPCDAGKVEKFEQSLWRYKNVFSLVEMMPLIMVEYVFAFVNQMPHQYSGYYTENSKLIKTSKTMFKKKTMKYLKSTIIVLSATLLTACVSNDPNVRTKQAAAIGTVFGAVLGHQVSSNNGKYIGAVLGGLAGAGAGRYMDQQRAELEAALERERAQGLEIQRLKDNSLKLNIPSEISFDFNSAQVNSGFRPTLDQIGTILNRYPETQIEIIGHTDSVGSDGYNLTLSERRAVSVETYFTQLSVAFERLSTLGVGESQPRSSNATEAGRQQNRRVEIIIKPNQV